MNSLGDTFAYPFQDPRWFGKIALQGLILIIPIIGWISMTGWLMLAFENARAGRRELPPAGFHLARGIGIFVIFFIYGFVLNIPAWILFIAGAIASGLNSHGVNAGSPLTSLGFLWMFFAGLFINFLVPSLMVNTYHRGFAGGMDVLRVWRLATSNVSNAVMAGVIVWVASVIGGLGTFVFFVGLFFTVVYQNAIQAGVAAWFEKVQPAPDTPATQPRAAAPGASAV